jgi:hypothetical protein
VQNTSTGSERYPAADSYPAPDQSRGPHVLLRPLPALPYALKARDDDEGRKLRCPECERRFHPDDEEDQDRGRSRRGEREAPDNTMPLIVLGIAGGVLVLGLVVGGVWLLKRGKAPPAVAGGAEDGAGTQQVQNTGPGGGHDKGRLGQAFVLGPDRALTLHSDSKLVPWSLPSGKAVYVVGEVTGRVALSPNRKYVAVARRWCVISSVLPPRPGRAPTGAAGC